MPRTRKHTFGPGALESLTLVTWKGMVVDTTNVKMNAVLRGTYTVYCGMGNEHDVDIDVKETGFSKDSDPTGKEILFIHEGEASARDFADNMVNWALEDWFDPCELEDEL